MKDQKKDHQENQKVIKSLLPNKKGKKPMKNQKKNLHLKAR